MKNIFNLWTKTLLIESKEGIILSVKVSPNAKQDKLVGWEGEYLKIRVAAMPEKGEANRAVVRFLSDVLQMPQRDITLAQGGSARIKRFLLSGISLVEAQERLSTTLDNRS